MTVWRGYDARGLWSAEWLSTEQNCSTLWHHVTSPCCEINARYRNGSSAPEFTVKIAAATPRRLVTDIVIYETIRHDNAIVQLRPETNLCIGYKYNSTSTRLPLNDWCKNKYVTSTFRRRSSNGRGTVVS